MRLDIEYDLLLALMRDKEMAQLLCTCSTIDKERELAEDAEPDVVGAEGQVQVLFPGVEDGVYEAVGAGDDLFCVLSIIFIFFCCRFGFGFEFGFGFGFGRRREMPMVSRRRTGPGIRGSLRCGR